MASKPSANGCLPQTVHSKRLTGRQITYCEKSCMKAELEGRSNEKVLRMRLSSSSDVLRRSQRRFKRHRLKLNPCNRACRICMRSERPDARAESLHLTDDKRLSIRVRRRWSGCGNVRHISGRTPRTHHVFFPRLAGIKLCTPSCCRMCA